MQHLSAAEVQARYGWVPPNGLQFALKPHDRILTPDFMARLRARVETDLGGRSIAGAVQTIYTDRPEDGGVLEYRPQLQPGETGANGDTLGAPTYLPFTKLVMSLGNQRVLAKNGTKNKQTRLSSDAGNNFQCLSSPC